MSTFSIFDSFTIEEAVDYGKKHKVRCRNNTNYRGLLTEGKEYEVTVIPSDLPMSPMCSFVGDDGGNHTCHLTRFEKI